MNIYAELDKLLSAGENVALATIVRTRGSTPREVGAQMLIRQSGTTIGTIGGGCGEADVWGEAMEAITDGKTRIIDVDLVHDHDIEGGRACGGIMTVFIEPVR